MNNYSYEEYMNNLLGNNTSIQLNNVITNTEPYEDENAFSTYQNKYDNNLEQYYPEIYKIVYPVICKKCLYLNEKITEEWIENMTNEIYQIVENDEYPEETRSINQQINYHNIRHIRNVRNINRLNENQSEIVEKRQTNFLLKDIIKILLLRELIGSGNRLPRQRSETGPLFSIQNIDKN